MQEVSGSSPLSSTRSTRSGHDLRPVRIHSKIVRPSSDRRSGHLQLALSRTDWFLMTAQACSCVVCVEHSGDRDAVAGIGKARPGSCRRLSYTVHAGARARSAGPAQMSGWLTAAGEIMRVALAEHTGPWTADDVEALPDAGDLPALRSTKGGVLVVRPAPGAGHRRASYRLHRALAQAAGRLRTHRRVLFLAAGR